MPMSQLTRLSDHVTRSTRLLSFRNSFHQVNPQAQADSATKANSICTTYKRLLSIGFFLRRRHIMDGFPTYVVEAFTVGDNQPFTGNTAAVCVLDFDDDITDQLKQKIGSQMNLSETAFISRGWTKSIGRLSSTAEDNHWTLRWFTPAKEVELCGHATLAAANIIFNQILKKNGVPMGGTLVFETKFKGRLEAVMDWKTERIALNFPASPPAPLPSALLVDPKSWVNRVVAAILGSKFDRAVIQDVLLPPALDYLFIRLKSSGDALKNANLLQSIEPDFNTLAGIKNEKGVAPLTGVVVTIEGHGHTGEKPSPRPHFYSRFFAPWSGINEDPVTGSAHTILAPFWFAELRRQGVDLEGGEILGQQLSARRGELLCSMIGEKRVKMVGQSRLGMAGQFYSG